MEIVRTRDINVIQFIQPLVAQHIESEKITEYTVERYLQFMRRGMMQQTFFVWTAYEESNTNVVGLLVALISSNLSNDYFTISCLAGTEEAEKKLLDNLDNFAKKSAINEIVQITRLPKKYKDLGFRVNRQLVVKRLE